MIPIFSAPSKTLEISRGEFSCPKCRQLRPYKHKERVVRKIFVLIPVLGERIEEYIECDHCHGKFPVTALRTKLAESTEQVVEGLKTKLTSGIAIEDAEALLKEAGMDISTIKQYVSVAAGINRKRCPQCNLTYRKNVVNCRKCSHVLPGAPVL